MPGYCGAPYEGGTMSEPQERHRRSMDYNEDGWRDHVDENLSSLRGDVGRIDARLGSFETTLTRIVDKLESRRFEWGWLIAAAVLLLSATQYLGDLTRNPISTKLDRLEYRLDQASVVSPNSLDFQMGQYEERFKTLQGSVESALHNRVDMDNRVRSEIATIEKELDTVRESLDNGLGHRIDEKTQGIKQDVEWLKEALKEKEE